MWDEKVWMSGLVRVQRFDDGTCWWVTPAEAARLITEGVAFAV